MSLHGSLRDFGLADILQLIGIQRKTGVLTFETAEDTVSVRFVGGQVVGADTRHRSFEDRLGAVLVRTGKLTDAQLQHALRVQKTSLQRLGRVLLAERLISEQELVDALRVQTLQIVYRLFRWREGTFNFRSAEDVDYDPKHFTPIGAETILMEGARMLDEWPIIERRIRSNQMVLRRTAAAATLLGDGGDPLAAAADESRRSAISLSAEEREVLDLVEAESTVEELCDRSTLGEFETCRILSELFTRNLLEEVRRPIVGQDLPAATDLLGRLARGLVYAGLAAAVAASLATLRANPLTPWAILARDDATERLRRHACEARLERLEQAIQVFYLDAGSFPASLELLARNGYVPVGELRDPWGQPFAYELSAGGYRLASRGRDGQIRPERSILRTFTAAQRMMLSGAPGADP
ncbi:MAG TPA: DUF4388 domain-containing protein [Candidatus Polarisedimenticolaceae bacterium]|nr:DUF4388 domain-containing protein [Candidatus Polarisedimenticolaceae bacterium]